MSLKLCALWLLIFLSLALFNLASQATSFSSTISLHQQGDKETTPNQEQTKLEQKISVDENRCGSGDKCEGNHQINFGSKKSGGGGGGHGRGAAGGGGANVKHGPPGNTLRNAANSLRFPTDFYSLILTLIVSALLF